MVPKIHASGGSFGGVMAYCLGDKRVEYPPYPEEDPSVDPEENERRHQAWREERDELKKQREEMEKQRAGRISKRVGWTETVNLDTDNPRQAARRMAATASYSQELKRQAGIAPGGRRLEKPVCHYTLSWKEGEQPGKAEQLKAVKESLKALKMSDRQAVVVSHKDGKCAHVHVVVNRVSWEDGRAAKLSRSRAALSKWAERWERERGQVQCKQRVRNNRERRKGRSVYDRESRVRDQEMRRGRKPVYLNRFKIRDGRTEDDARYVARFRVVEREQRERAWRLSRDVRADLMARQRQEWSDLMGWQRSEKSKAAEVGHRAVKAVEREIRTSREEQAIGQAVGQTLGEKLQKFAEARGGVWRLEAAHQAERSEMRGKHSDELDAHAERVQVDFYDKPMAKAHQEGYELDRYDDTSRQDFEREMQKQGFPIRGPERRRERDIGPSR